MTLRPFASGPEDLYDSEVLSDDDYGPNASVERCIHSEHIAERSCAAGQFWISCFRPSYQNMSF